MSNHLGMKQLNCFPIIIINNLFFSNLVIKKDPLVKNVDMTGKVSSLVFCHVASR